MADNQPEILDVTQDMATLLRKGTATAHDVASSSDVAAWLTRGELDKNEYIRFLIILWHIYSAIEEALDNHAEHPVLAPAYNPTLLARAPALSSDIAHLLGVPESSWKSHPSALSISKEPPLPLVAYTQRIRTIASSADSSTLLAHAYVRYLGDLSGGQIIRRNIAKAYNLDSVTGLGTQFYEFQKLGGGGTAGIGDMRTIKAWYRNEVNKGVGDDAQRKLAMVAEANTAFELNGAIFTTIRPPSNRISKESTAIVSPVNTKPAEGTVSVASVLSFILAMGIAHFALVTGGFLGDSGLEKWDRAREWVASALGVA